MLVIKCEAQKCAELFTRLFYVFETWEPRDEIAADFGFSIVPLKSTVTSIVTVQSAVRRPNH